MKTAARVCGGLAVVSAAWVFASGFGLADLVWVEGLGAPASPLWRMTEGIMAGTAVGKWWMLAFAATVVPRRAFAGLVAAEALAEAALWVHAGLPLGLASIVPSLGVLAVVAFDRGPPRPRAAPGRGPWLQLACAWFAVLGGLVIFDFHGVVFDRYRDALADLDPTAPWPFVELAFVRIAVGFVTHYAALTLALRLHGPTATLLRTALAAQVAWFLLDSSASVVHGAAFNVVQINVPGMALFLVAWWVTWRRVIPATPARVTPT